MDFKLSKTHLLQQEMYRKFAETEIKPIAEEMAKYIDAVSISLNAPTAERYQEVTQPCFENAFPDMLAFAEKAKKLFSSVQFSVVSIISQEEIDASQKIADEMGIPLKVRIYS